MAALSSTGISPPFYHEHFSAVPWRVTFPACRDTHSSMPHHLRSTRFRWKPQTKSSIDGQGIPRHVHRSHHHPLHPSHHLRQSVSSCRRPFYTAEQHTPWPSPVDEAAELLFPTASWSSILIQSSAVFMRALNDILAAVEEAPSSALRVSPSAAPGLTPARGRSHRGCELVGGSLLLTRPWGPFHYLGISIGPACIVEIIMFVITLSMWHENEPRGQRGHEWPDNSAPFTQKQNMGCSMSKEVPGSIATRENPSLLQGFAPLRQNLSEARIVVGCKWLSSRANSHSTLPTHSACISPHVLDT